jgi:hypothetical protein
MDLYGFTVGGGAVTNPGRYLVLVPPTLVDAGSTYALTDIRPEWAPIVNASGGYDASGGSTP